MSDRSVVVPGSSPLRNGQHEEFAQAVAAGLSMHDAWVTAGFSATSNNSARLAAKPRVVARIDHLRRAANDRIEGGLETKLQWYQRKLIERSFPDPTKFAEIDALRNCTLLDLKKAAAVATKFEIAGGKAKFEFDQAGEFTKLGKTLGVFIKKTELTGAGGGPVEVENVTDAQRIRALAAVLTRVRIENESDGAGGLSAAVGIPDSPSASVTGPELPLAAARRALAAAARAAQGAVADGAAAEFLIQKLRGLADAIEEELARSTAARSAAG